MFHHHQAVKSPTREGDGAALVTGVPPNVEGKAESPRRSQKNLQSKNVNKASDNDAHYSDDTFEESEDQSKGKEGVYCFCYYFTVCLFVCLFVYDPRLWVVNPFRLLML